MPLKTQLKAASEKLRQDFEQQTAAFGQNLDKGEAREAALRAVLRRWLPGRYSVGRGEVVDAKGAHSKQQDVVIYDGFNSPLIFQEQDSPAIFPVESVYGFVEVKSKLSLESMVDSWNKTISVYSLNRQEFSNPLGGITISGNYKPFSAAFAFDGPKDLSELTHVWREMAMAYPPHGRLNMICILGRGCLMYLSETKVWSLGNFASDVPTLVQTGDDSLLMFMLSAWTAMGEAPGLRIPNPMAYAGGSLKYDVLTFGPEPPEEHPSGV